MVEGLRTIIVDDEAAAVRRLVHLCAALPMINIIATAGGGAAALALLEHTPVDLILLDIEMPCVSGLEVAERLAARRTMSSASVPAVIFVTAFDKFAIRAFAVDAVGYLLKPVDPELLRATVERVTRRTVMAAPAVEKAIFWAPVRGTLVRIEAKDIDRVSSEDDYARLHCGTSSYLVTDRLYEIEQRLAGEGFIRVHRSSLVSIDRIASLDVENGAWTLCLRDGDRVPVGRSFLSSVRRTLGINHK